MKKSVENGIDFLKDITENVTQNINNKGYDDGIEIGKSNTIKSLLYANINDRDTFISAVRKVWNMDETEIEDRIVFEKKAILTEKIKEYLRFNGNTEGYIKDFFRENQVIIKLKDNCDLWKLKDNPEKLIKAISEKK